MGGLYGVLLLLLTSRMAAESQAGTAVRFFREGGSYCFRVAPEGVAMAEETEWTVMVLTSADNGKKTFRIREIDPGRSGFMGATLRAMGEVVTGVWRADRTRAEFFEAFAAEITAGRLRASVVRIHPNNLERLTSDRERAELYLAFSGRGARVSFDKAPDLSASEFAQYAGYFPD